MTLQEFVAARVGTRFYAVNPSGRLTIDVRRGGASRAISSKLHDKLECAWKRGEEPGDKLTDVDLRLLRKIEQASTSQIILAADGTFWHPYAGTIDRRRIRSWVRRGIVGPLQTALFLDVPSSYTVTPKGLRIGKAAPHA